MELLSDWRALAGALEGEAAERHSAAETTNLLLLLRASLHRACGGILVPARQDARYGLHMPTVLCIGFGASATAARARTGTDCC